jgi:hypothetical protein
MYAAAWVLLLMSVGMMEASITGLEVDHTPA